MKKLMFLLLLLPMTAFTQVQYIMTDTSVMTRPNTNVTPYSAQDIVRPATGSAFFSVNVCGLPGLRTYLDLVKLSVDTAYTSSTNPIFDLIPFIDTTGVGAQLAADNAPYQWYYGNDAKRLPPITIALMTYGTTASGATTASGSQYSINLPFITPSTGKLFFLLIEQSATTPKLGGIYKLTVTTSYY